jgi:general secretion pathway protein G
MVEMSPIRAGRAGKEGESGFTLMELMIVMMIIGVLSAMAAPIFIHDVTRAREAVLREDLHTMRVAIDSYTIDKEKAPQSLEDLVQAGYLKAVPVDPMTNHNDTWILGQSEDMTSVEETQGGISDVHSGAQGAATDGSSYSTW